MFVLPPSRQSTFNSLPRPRSRSCYDAIHLRAAQDYVSDSLGVAVELRILEIAKFDRKRDDTSARERKSNHEHW
jgi:hypothetical protein